jgi:hypothetical protein
LKIFAVGGKKRKRKRRRVGFAERGWSVEES